MYFLLLYIYFFREMRNELLIDLEQHDDEAKRGSDKVDANSPTEEPLEAAPAIADREKYYWLSLSTAIPLFIQ